VIQVRRNAVTARLMALLLLVTGALVGPGVHVAEAAIGPVTVSVASASVTEGDGGTRRMFFAVTLSRPRTTASSVAYSTIAGTALAGTDYVTTSGTLTFPAGTTSMQASVLVKGNVGVDPATRSFSVQLSSPVGVVLGQASATGTIRDDDGAVHGSVSIGSAAVVAGNAATKVWFAVTLAQPAAGDVSVAYATKAGTAVAARDFVATSGRLRIPAGSRSAPLAVAVTGSGGTGGRAASTFTVKLSAPTGATLDRATGTGTIRRTGYNTAKAWAQRGGDAGLTSNASAETTLTAANLAAVDKRWSAATCCVERGTHPVSDGPSVYVVQRVSVFAGSAGHLAAYDLATGALRWSIAAEQDNAQWNLSVAEGIVVAVGRCAPTNFTCLRGYHTSDGTVAWSHLLGPGSFTSTPTVANGVVYIGDSFGILELSLRTGATISGFQSPWDLQAAVAGGRIFRGDWVYATGSNQKLWYGAHAAALRSATATDVFTHDDGALLAWNAVNGASRWSTPLACSSTSQPAVAGDLVVVQACGTLRAYDRTTGSSRWTFPLTQPSDLQPTIANGLVYVSDESADLFVVNASTGASVRTIDLGTNEIVGSTLVVDGRIVVSGKAALEVYGL
jgi:hypothetical protein